MNNIVIFCDFDGTITINDTVDHLLSIYANKNWINIEESWKNGEIGSKECLKKQLECIDYISEKQLNEFIEDIEIDVYFINFLEFIKIQENLNHKKIELYVVSDGFDFFINRTLEKYGIKRFVKVFSNKLNYSKGKLTPVFPLFNPYCKKDSGLCKCEIIKKFKKDMKVLYIGDGTSDICAANLADILFAKDSLAEYCDQNAIKYIKFETFKDICEYLYLNLGEEQYVKNEMLVG